MPDKKKEMIIKNHHRKWRNSTNPWPHSHIWGPPGSKSNERGAIAISRRELEHLMEAYIGHPNVVVFVECEAVWDIVTVRNKIC